MRDRDDAFTAFVRASGPALSRTAFFLTTDSHLAEDLVQSALAQTYAHWPSIRDLGSAEAYARRILVNANAAWWRRRSATELPIEVVPDGVRPDDTAAIAEREPLMAALRLLSPRQRAALVLRFFDDLSEADTARILGCSAGSVKRHTARGLDRLRELLGQEAVAPLRVRPVVEPTWR